MISRAHPGPVVGFEDFPTDLNDWRRFTGGRILPITVQPDPKPTNSHSSSRTVGFRDSEGRLGSRGIRGRADAFNAVWI